MQPMPIQIVHDIAAPQRLELYPSRDGLPLTSFVSGGLTLRSPSGAVIESLAASVLDDASPLRVYADVAFDSVRYPLGRDYCIVWEIVGATDDDGPAYTIRHVAAFDVVRLPLTPEIVRADLVAVEPSLSYNQRLADDRAAAPFIQQAFGELFARIRLHRRYPDLLPDRWQWLLCLRAETLALAMASFGETQKSAFWRERSDACWAALLRLLPDGDDQGRALTRAASTGRLTR